MAEITNKTEHLSTAIGILRFDKNLHILDFSNSLFDIFKISKKDGYTISFYGNFLIE